jgi:hypothetical protein
MKTATVAVSGTVLGLALGWGIPRMPEAYAHIWLAVAIASAVVLFVALSWSRLFRTNARKVGHRLVAHNDDYSESNLQKLIQPYIRSISA